MIDPLNPPTLPQAQRWELEEFLLFAVLVAGHNAERTATSLEVLLRSLPCHSLARPFRQIQFFAVDVEDEYKGEVSVQMELASLMKDCGIGCYRAKAKSFLSLAYVEPELDLVKCQPNDLEGIYGIGKKTSRFFIMYTRPWVNDYAILDTHVLKWMGKQGYSVPKQTPSGRRYNQLEYSFLEEAWLRNMTSRELDQAIWTKATRS